MGMSIRNLGSSTRQVLTVTALLAVGVTASCQLLLPDGEEGTGGDATSTTGRGGAMTTSGKTVGVTTTAHTATATAAETTTVVASSSSGRTCDPGGNGCDEQTTFEGCGGGTDCNNPNCSGYCHVIQNCSQNLTQYGSVKQCCAACEQALDDVDTTNSLCCRADALLQGANQDSCTAAGPFGVVGNSGECGTQNDHVCSLLFAVCINFIPVLNCSLDTCKANYQGKTTDSYQFGASSSSDEIAYLMDLTLGAVDGNKSSLCQQAFGLACPPISAIAVATSGGG